MTDKTVAERAVEGYHQASEALHDFLADAEVRDILLEMEHLIADYNRKLDTAMRAIKSELKQSDRAKLIIDGLGAQKRFKRYYDGEFLANALPADQSDEVLTERVVYDVDKDRLEQLLRQGEIDNDIVEKAYHEEEQNPSNLPGTPKPYLMPAIPVPE